MQNEFNASPEQLAKIGLLTLRWRQLDRQRIKHMRNQYASSRNRNNYLDLSKKAEDARLSVSFAISEVLGSGQA